MTDIKKSKKELIDELKDLRQRIEEFKSVEDKRLETQKAFVESEERYRSVFENTGTATIIIENNMTISMVNAKFEELTGLSKKEIQGKMKWTEFVVDADVERMKGYHVKRRENRRSAPKEYECRVRNRSGEIKDMFVRIDMIAGTLSSVASFNDVTAFKQTEKALIESERKLSKLMGNLPGMAYRCLNDNLRTMNYVSAGCKWLTDYAAFELIDTSKMSIDEQVQFIYNKVRKV